MKSLNLTSKNWKTLSSTKRYTFLLRKISPSVFGDEFDDGEYIYFVVPIFRDILYVGYTTKDYHVCSNAGLEIWYKNFIFDLNMKSDDRRKCYYMINQEEIHSVLPLKQQGVYNLSNPHGNRILSSFEYKRSNFKNERLVLVGGVNEIKVQRFTKRNNNERISVETVSKIRLPKNTGGRDVNGLVEWKEENCVIVFSVLWSTHSIHSIRLTDPKEKEKYIPQILSSHRCGFTRCSDFDKIFFDPKQKLLLACFEPDRKGESVIIGDFRQHPDSITSKLSQNLHTRNSFITVHEYVEEKDLLITSSFEAYFELWKFDPFIFDFVKHKRVVRGCRPLRILSSSTDCFFVVNENEDEGKGQYDELMIMKFEEEEDGKLRKNESLPPIRFNEREKKGERFGERNVLWKMDWYWKKEGFVLFSRKDVFVLLVIDLKKKSRLEKKFVRKDLKERVHFLNECEFLLRKNIVLVGRGENRIIRIEWSFC